MEHHTFGVGGKRITSQSRGNLPLRAGGWIEPYHKKGIQKLPRMIWGRNARVPISRAWIRRKETDGNQRGSDRRCCSKRYPGRFMSGAEERHPLQEKNKSDLPEDGLTWSDYFGTNPLCSSIWSHQISCRFSTSRSNDPVSTPGPRP